jgi:hypothetical protein
MSRSTRTTDLNMAAYYLAEASRRNLSLKCTVENGKAQSIFVFDDPNEMIPELEQSWPSSIQAQYSGFVRALRSSAYQVRKRRNGDPRKE